MRQAGFLLFSSLAVILASDPAIAQQCAISAPVPAAGASIGTPGALALDVAGNLYFTSASCILRIDPSGMLTRVAGTSSSGYSGDGAAAASAQLNGPEGLVADPAGNLYIADTGNHSIRMMAPNGSIRTIAGNGNAGYSGDGGPAASAALNGPQGLAADRFGNLYIADTNNNVVRRIAANGVITTFAGNGAAGYSFDGFFARDAQLNLPTGLAVSSGNLYIADSANNRVRLVTAARLITTLAGNGTAGYSGDNGVGGQDEDAELNLPTFVVSDSLGLNIYISDSKNGRIRQVLPDTIITTVAGGNQSLSTPAGLALDASGNLFIADASSSRILKMTPDGTLTTIAGK